MIRIFEVGPRDGLQNERKLLTVEQKLDLIESLLKAGLRSIEIGAFVRPDRVPQMAGTDELFHTERLARLQKEYPEAQFWALVPNEKGLDRAIECGARRIAVFGGATETFVKKNIGMSVADSISTFSGVVRRALKEGMTVRGYVSVCWICPYEGEVPPDSVLAVVRPLLDMGIPEISIADTIGQAHPTAVDDLLALLLKTVPPSAFAVHFHDTYGMALVNIDRSLQHGIRCIDSSLGGLGGCPYAPGAAGNVATEDVYTLMEGYGKRGFQIEALDSDALMDAAGAAQRLIGRTLPSKRLRACIANRKA